VNKKPIDIRDDLVYFDERVFTKNTKTNYIVWGTGKDDIPKEYYTLEGILFLLQHAELRHPVYVRQAAASNVPYIRRPNRKDLLAYLKGDKATSSAIDKSVPSEVAIDRPTPPKRTADGTIEEEAKKPRMEDEGLQREQDHSASKESTQATDQISGKKGKKRRKRGKKNKEKKSRPVIHDL